MASDSERDTGGPINDASAYEGRPDNPEPDTDAARRGPAAGSGPPDGGGASHHETEREGGGSARERD